MGQLHTYRLIYQEELSLQSLYFLKCYKRDINQLKLKNLFKNWHGEIIGNRFGLQKVAK